MPHAHPKKTARLYGNVPMIASQCLCAIAAADACLWLMYYSNGLKGILHINFGFLFKNRFFFFFSQQIVSVEDRHHHYHQHYSAHATSHHITFASRSASSVDIGIP